MSGVEAVPEKQDAFVRIEGLEKSYTPGSRAVDGVSLSVRKGECLVLLGPSGCGKTTTLRCVAGFETAERGRISIGGHVVFDGDRGLSVAPSRRGIGMVFQSFAIWPHMTVLENVSYPLRIRRVPRADVEARARAAIEVVGLSGFESRGASMLSGGQMQRVSLARSLVYEPDLLLLDEPLSSLDAALRERLRFEIKSILEKTGTTAIYVTHDQSEAVVLGNSIAVMQGGRVTQLGDGHEIFRRPANEFVARFTGAVNRITAEVTTTSADGHCEVVLAAGQTVRVALPRDPVARELTAPGSECVVVTRPESLTISRTPQEYANNWIPGTVTSVRFLGTHTSFGVDIHGEDVTVDMYGTVADLDVGEAAWVGFNPDDATALLPQGSD